MRIFLGLLSLIVCTAFGYYFSLKYVEKRKFYSDFLTFNKRYRSEINFSFNTIGHIINNFNDGKFIRILKNVYKEEEIEYPKFLNEEEINFLDSYISYIGKTDKFTQENFIDSVNGNLINYYNVSVEEEKKYKNYYVKLGFLIGLIVFVALL